jgi:hypothetical protein
MKVLFIGGTGIISSAVSQHALTNNIELYHLNRGQSHRTIDGVKNIQADIRNIEQSKKTASFQDPSGNSPLRGPKQDIATFFPCYMGLSKTATHFSCFSMPSSSKHSQEVLPELSTRGQEESLTTLHKMAAQARSFPLSH